MESKEILTMRQIALSRAIGELNALLNTYWEDSHEYSKAKTCVKEFIIDITELMG